MYQKSWWYDLQFLRYKVWQAKTGNSTSFFALLPPPLLKSRKIRIFKNWKKKLLEISSFYTCVPKTTIIWGTVPEIWSEIDRIFCHFRPFFPPFTPLTTAESKFWKNEKSNWICHHFTHCTNNHYHMMYVSWYMECTRHTFLSFWVTVCPFSPLLTPKIKIWKKCKNLVELFILLHVCTINEDHMMYGSWDIRCDKSFLSFWAIFCPLTPLTTLNIKILKNEKNARRYHHFIQLYQKSWSYATLFLRHKALQM